MDGDGWRTAAIWRLCVPTGRSVSSGRYKDMLKVGGENVDPMEVEALLLQHPAVSQAQVVGVPDARLQESHVRRAAARRADGRVGSHRLLSRQGRQLWVPRHVLVMHVSRDRAGRYRKVKLRELSIEALGLPRHK